MLRARPAGVSDGGRVDQQADVHEAVVADRGHVGRRTGDGAERDQRPRPSRRPCRSGTVRRAGWRWRCRSCRPDRARTRVVTDVGNRLATPAIDAHRTAAAHRFAPLRHQFLQLGERSHRRHDVARHLQRHGRERVAAHPLVAPRAHDEGHVDGLDGDVALGVIRQRADRGAGDEEVVDRTAERLGRGLGVVERYVQHLEVATARPLREQRRGRVRRATAAGGVDARSVLRRPLRRPRRPACSGCVTTSGDARSPCATRCRSGGAGCA